MILFIVIGIILILGVNSLYSRLCESAKRPSQFLHGNAQVKIGPSIRTRL